MATQDDVQSRSGIDGLQGGSALPRWLSWLHLFGYRARRGRIDVSPLTARRQRRCALQIGRGGAEDARKWLGTIVVTAQLLYLHCAWQRLRTIVAAATGFYSTNRRQRFRVIIVAAALAHTVWNMSPMEDLAPQLTCDQWRRHDWHRD